ncbi:MAG TPA: prolipoprotein diacylglyceryl transferase family protein [Solirubrobacteraceae bacterium]|nr:prolipoprotein diacylglyceryl transferase family protein [Solirubrobacteraceae bacterium]
MLPEVVILGIPIQTFGFFFGLNFVVWGALAARRLKELGKPVDWAYEMVFVALAGGLVGAKLWWVIDERASLSLGGLFSGSGLTWYGGLLGGLLAMLVWARRRDVLNLRLADIAGFCLPLGYAVGRIGCQVSGDGDYGVPAPGLPWAMPYPDGTVPTLAEVHPAPIYETLAMGLAAYVLWRLRDRVRPGVLFALYLILAGVERFLVEFVRRNEDVLAGLTQAQVLSIALTVAAAGWLAYMAVRRGGLGAAPQAAPA